jgi:PTH1 family peptidyl-tRNA hydrolase|tara:strand:+ start:1911 stop:2462 length:552 start_codon:yes stop_codon:yes gene_type:complete
MLLFSGLGNPGQKFKHNRHNIGFILIDEISNKCEFKKKFKGLFGENQIGQIKSYFLKPMTFMNLSGESLLEIKQFFKLKNGNIFIIHDDLDLEIGKVKVKNGGSNAGHNGLESISSKIGNDYNRLRIGIGHPGQKDLVDKYVLSNFKSDEYDLILKTITSVKDNINVLIDKKFDEFSSKVNNL